MSSSNTSSLRAGIDLGGTKCEIAVLQGSQIIWRKRCATPDNYEDLLVSLSQLVSEASLQFAFHRIGVAMPGAVNDDGSIKNANTTYLIGKSFEQDLSQALNLPVRLMNDANCFALSEAEDGAALHAQTVFGVIVGTGTGGAIVLNRMAWTGVNSIAGEWGHNALCRRTPVAAPTVRPCYCGKTDCVETYLSGKGLRQTAFELIGQALTGEDVAKAYLTGDIDAKRIVEFYAQQLAANLAVVVNIVDPDVIVLGGGLSNLPDLPELTQKALAHYVFSNTVKTQVVRNLHGDSSGVRGAAWLWGDDD